MRDCRSKPLKRVRPSPQDETKLSPMWHGATRGWGALVILRERGRALPDAAWDVKLGLLGEEGCRGRWKLTEQISVQASTAGDPALVGGFGEIGVAERPRSALPTAATAVERDQLQRLVEARSAVGDGCSRLAPPKPIRAGSSGTAPVEGP